MFSLELKTIEQWVTVTECLVHMSYRKFEEIKMKSVKRSKSCHYVDDLSDVL